MTKEKKTIAKKLPFPIPKASLNLKSWRQNQGLTQKQLTDELLKRVLSHFPDTAPPRGAIIHQPDISDAESGSPEQFKKVTEAIYQYFDVPPGHFGSIGYKSQTERLTFVAEESIELVREQDSEIIKLQKLVIELQSHIIRLQKDLMDCKSNS